MQVRGVEMRFGGIVALAGVSFDVGSREICGLIGPNGSGKTTMFNCISGFYRYIEGDILFEGKSVKDLPRHRMVELGIGRTFQNVALFRSMTVRENMMVGHHYRGTSGFFSNALRLPQVQSVTALVRSSSYQASCSTRKKASRGAPAANCTP